LRCNDNDDCDDDVVDNISSPQLLNIDILGTNRVMNFVNIEYGRVYFAKYLISPLSNCRFISKHSIMMIRKAVSQIFNLNLIIPSLSSSASLVEEGGKNF